MTFSRGLAVSCSVRHHFSRSKTKLCVCAKTDLYTCLEMISHTSKQNYSDYPTTFLLQFKYICQTEWVIDKVLISWSAFRHLANIQCDIQLFVQCSSTSLSSNITLQHCEHQCIFRQKVLANRIDMCAMQCASNCCDQEDCGRAQGAVFDLELTAEAFVLPFTVH